EATATLTFNRPAALNAMNQTMLSELEQAIDELASDQAVRAVIVTGSGARAFVAGADIRELRAIEGSPAGEAFARAGHRVLGKVSGMDKPTIAAINGFALGGGCEVALSCDVRIAAENARIGLPEIRLGIIPGWGGTQIMPRLLGSGRAALLILSGEPVDAAEAYRIGLVDRVVPGDQLLEEALRLAAALAERPPLSVRAAKRAMRFAHEGPLSAGRDLEAALFGGLFSTEDRIEGTSAFLEKRQPVFRGR
ncbi:MAG: enoyl-CoA hydratase/isomerase family protein, partial [Chloroflexi bacterium]|nr:enoyl-CoA hydratase/isomerase family protein [Chloroflexota bacterium]